MSFLNLSLDPIQIEFELKKLISSLTQVIEIFAEVHPNIGLGSNWVKPIRTSFTPNITNKKIRYDILPCPISCYIQHIKNNNLY